MGKAIRSRADLGGIEDMSANTDFEPIEGGCLCGSVRYRISAPPLRTGLCHCRMCQRAGGAPVVSWVIVTAESFEFIDSEPQAYQSSAQAIRRFCAKCGGQLTFEHTNTPHEIDVTAASLDNPDAYPPRYAVWSQSRLGYMGHVDVDLEIHEKNRNG